MTGGLRMDIEATLEALNETGCRATLAPFWGESMVSLPNEAPDFLRPEFFSECRAYAGLADEAQPPLEEAAARILAEPPLRMLAWHCHRRLYACPGPCDTSGWPTLDTALGPLSGCFYLLLGLDMTPRVRAAHAAMGFEESITRDTCAQLWSFNDNYRRGTGRVAGLWHGQLGWLTHYVAGRLFRLGRFEYKLEPFWPFCHVFRHRATGLVVSIAAEGLTFNREGFVAGARGIDDGAGAWLSTFREGPLEVVGYPILPTGTARREKVRLDMTVWEPILQPGDTVLDMHIPAGGGMTPERCVDSMRRAAAFFSQHFPDRPARAVVCNSWIFGPQLEGILPPDANLVRYMRELYLFPVPSPGSGGLWFIFFRDPVEPATAPRENRLQAAVADYLAAGGVWRQGGMFILLDDLDGYGTQHYRATWESVESLLAPA